MDNIDNDNKFEFVKSYLAENQDKDEIKGLLDSFTKITPDKLNNWIDADELGKKWFQATTDKRVTQAIKTYEEKTLPDKLTLKVEEEIRKRYPPQTEEQKRLAEFQRKAEETENKNKKLEMRWTASECFSNKGLSNFSDFVDNFLGESDEETRTMIDRFAERWAQERDKIRTEELAKLNRAPQSGDTEDKKRFASMSELQKYLAGHPERYNDTVQKEFERLSSKR